MGNFKVVGDGMVDGPIADSSNFEYDPVTRMYKKKDGLVELEVRRMGKDDKKEEKDEAKEEEKTETEKNGSKENKEDIMDELVKEIEELENEVESKDDDVKIGTEIDWGSSALSEILTEKEKEERKKKKEEEKKKKEEGEVSDGVEDGEVSSGDEKKRY